MFKRRKWLSLVLIAALVLVMSGCLKNGNLALVNSDLAGQNKQNVDPGIKTVKLEFNHKVAEAQASLIKNEESAGNLKVETEGKVVNITNLNLEQVSNYQLEISVKDEAGTQLRDSISFKTGMLNYPEVKQANKTLMQTFYWEMAKGKYVDQYPEESNLWKLLKKRSDELAKRGITEVWIPPAHKGHSQDDEGYGIYDPWDLGEFNQAGGVRTKYGTKEELEEAVSALHEAGIKVYYDAVMNQRIGGKLEEVPLKSGKTTQAYTKYSPLKGRQKYYSKADEFKWNWKCFDGVERGKPTLFEGKDWDDTYDKDYLLGSDVDYQNPNVKHEMKEWGKWLINEMDFDGFRIDAIKHIDTPFTNEWVTDIQENTDKDVKFIGEAWIDSSMGLKFYLMSVGSEDLDAFDFPLRQAFNKLKRGNLNMSALSSAGLINDDEYAARTVTFVDNHDTGRDEVEYQSPINSRKMQAYTYILTREEGIPMVYWKDYYISGYKEDLNKLLDVRKYFAYGPGREAKTNDQDVYSYIREGLKDKPGTGLVMMITGGDSKEVIKKKINTGKANTTFYDYTGNIKEKITTDAEGYGQFKVKDSADKGWSVWVPLKQN